MSLIRVLIYCVEFVAILFFELEFNPYHDWQSCFTFKIVFYNDVNFLYLRLMKSNE